MPSFGVNVVCFRGDYPFAKACCASIRRHLGNIPICLFVDGDFDVQDLERAYGIQTKYPRDLADQQLRRRSYGYGLTKMVVLWESPFERFLYLDADTVVWGDVLQTPHLHDADFVFNHPHEPYTDFILKSQYFDYERLFAHTRPFRWQGQPFFNTGVFVASRGLFSTADYYELLDLKLKDPSLLPTGEQGILNVMVFRAAAEGRITIAQAPLQAVVPVIPREELARRFRIDRRGPRISPDDRTVIHWAGAKPFSLHSSVFRAPMSYYRRQSLRERRSYLAALGPAGLLIEELRADGRQALPPRLRTITRVLKRHVKSALGIGLTPAQGI